MEDSGEADRMISLEASVCGGHMHICVGMGSANTASDYCPLVKEMSFVEEHVCSKLVKHCAGWVLQKWW